ncbi:MAG: hypothetical protein CMK59_10605 [Proteobacteria bacterium]|nr:hypothetical protein [Pseudomonadota bacterium]
MSFVLFFSCASYVPVPETVEPQEESLEISEPISEEAFSEEDFQNGSYAMLMVIGRELEDPSPLNNDWGKQQTTSLVLLDWTRSETQLEYVETHCALSVSDDFGTMHRYSDHYLDAISDRVRMGSLSSAQVGADFTIPEYIDLNGVNLNNPSDPLPTHSTDSRIYDMDEDGQVGVTITVDASVGTGEVYAIQRRSYALSGTVISQERIEGYVVASPEQVSLDFSEFWLEYGTSEDRADSDPTRSYFIIQEIDSSWGCADILSNQSSLF